MTAIALAALLCVSAAGCPAADDDAPSADVDGDTSADSQADTAPADNPAACPEQHPIMMGNLELRCIGQQPGLSCTYPAPDCAGSKPDNTCVCSDKMEWLCGSPFQTCQPLAEDGRPSAGTRGIPDGPAAACETPAWDPSATCEPGQAASVSKTECDTTADCGAGSLCLDTHDFGGSSFCGCHQPQCETSADCGDGFVCHCGQTDSSTRCGGWGPKPCHHTCIPALCVSNADCDEGGICAASRDICSWQVERYACQYPDRAECLSDAECYDGSACQYNAAEAGWRCIARPVCE